MRSSAQSLASNEEVEADRARVPAGKARYEVIRGVWTAAAQGLDLSMTALPESLSPL